MTDGLEGLAERLVEAVKPAPLLLSCTDAAAYLGLSEREFYRLKAAGEMCKPRRVPGRTEPLYHRGDLDRWADDLAKGSALPARRTRAT